MFLEQMPHKVLVFLAVCDEHTSLRVAGLCSTMYANTRASRDISQEWHIITETRRDSDYNLVHACWDDIIKVLQCRHYCYSFFVVDCSSDGFPVWLLSFEFVNSHSFFEYAASIPKSAPAKVAISPKATSSVSCSCPFGSIYTPQKRRIIPPSARIAAVNICKFDFMVQRYNKNASPPRK